MHSELEQRLRFFGNLPTLPAIALKVIELANNPEVHLNDVAKVVAMDPALVTKLFRVANSPLYGLRRQATNLRQVVNLLGLQGTLALALGFSLVTTARNIRSVPLDMEQFWRRSLLVATACQVLGERLGMKNLEELFLAGLLHGIGILALALMIPDQYGGLLTDAADHQGKGASILNCERLAQREQEHLGTNHAQIGAWLLRHWGLPEYLHYAVAGSLQPAAPELPEQYHEIAKCVALAIHAADIWMRPGYWQSSPQVAGLAQQWFALGTNDYVAILEAIGAKFPEISDLFQIQPLDATEVAGILEQAREVLTIRDVRYGAGIFSQWSQPENAEQATLSLERPPSAEVGVAPYPEDRFAATSTPEQPPPSGILTALFDHEHMNQLVQQELVTAREHRWPLSLALLDLDHYKHINDTYGRDIGDQALIALARLLRGNIRRSDVVARYGNDEFALLLPASGVEAARYLINRLLALIRDWELPLAGGRNLRLTVSAGLATYPDTNLTNCETAEQLLRAADRALYVAKREGRDRLAVYGE
ncbi:MAG: GGDEF domain-containing protein [Candidatus Competibacteraceae bacterium]